MLNMLIFFGRIGFALLNVCRIFFANKTNLTFTALLSTFIMVITGGMFLISGESYALEFTIISSVLFVLALAKPTYKITKFGFSILGIFVKKEKKKAL